MVLENHDLIALARERKAGLATSAAHDSDRPGPEAAHLTRVAAWCAESGSALDLSTRDCRILQQAVRLHHQTALVVKPDAWDSFRQDLGIARPARNHDSLLTEALEVLRALHGDRSAAHQARTLALILEQCDDLDNACELDATVAAEDAVSGLAEMIAEFAQLFANEASSSSRAARQLPVFPAVAQEVFALLADHNLNFGHLESIVSSDPTLAGHIISAANSAAAGGTFRVNTIAQALGRIGVVTARRVVRASALRSLYSTPRLRRLWNHSLDVAEAAGQLAAQTSLVNVEEAFLAGLMLDVGKLALSSSSGTAPDRQDRLLQAGCPDWVVEHVIFGQDHASIGSQLLRDWNFVERTAAAVAYHHRPERDASPLCSLLYLAEVSCPYPALNVGAARLASPWRENAARRALAIKDVNSAPPNRSLVLPGLRFAMAA